MPEYEWKRMNPGPDDPGWPFGFDYEYATTTTLEPPPNDDPHAGPWRRVYSVGVGSVPGAGGSPARPVRRQK